MIKCAICQRELDTSPGKSFVGFGKGDGNQLAHDGCYSHYKNVEKAMKECWRGLNPESRERSQARINADDWTHTLAVEAVAKLANLGKP